LRWPNVDGVTNLVANRLSEKDLDPNDIVVASIDNYINDPYGGTDPNAVLEALTKEFPEGRPMWQEQLKRWAECLGQAKGADKADKSAEADN